MAKQLKDKRVSKFLNDIMLILFVIIALSGVVSFFALVGVLTLEPECEEGTKIDYYKYYSGEYDSADRETFYNLTCQTTELVKTQIGDDKVKIEKVKVQTTTTFTKEEALENKRYAGKVFMFVFFKIFIFAIILRMILSRYDK